MRVSCFYCAKCGFKDCDWPEDVCPVCGHENNINLQGGRNSE